MSHFRQLGIATLLLMIAGFLLGNLAFMALSMDMESLSTGDLSNTLSPQRLRIGLFVSHFFTFAIPGFLALYYFYRQDWWRTVNPLPFPGRKFGLMVLFTLAAIPLVALSMWINLQLPLPEWAMQTEDQTSQVLEKILTFESPAGLITALLAVAVAAGVGEELVFRGILQGKVLGRLNHHWAIWIAAICFSLIHLELAGFLPRMLLGAILGYVFHWSGSLLVPILLHTLFNGIQVVAAYVSGEFTPDTAPVELPDWFLILPSLLFTLALGYYLEKNLSGTIPPPDHPGTDADHEDLLA